MSQDYPTTAAGVDLQDWGAKTIPKGVHRGKTFKEVYDDQKTCNWYRNRSTASSAEWLVSFVAFIKASDYLKNKSGSESEWEAVVDNEGETGAMDPPAEQPEPCQFSLTVPAGSHVSIVVVTNNKNTSAGQK